MRLEGIARIHLHSPVRASAACRRSAPRRHAAPAAPAPSPAAGGGTCGARCRRARSQVRRRADRPATGDVAAAIGERLGAATPRSCAAIAQQRRFELPRGRRRGAAQHDRHAAADRAVARQRRERSRNAPPAPSRDRARGSRRPRSRAASRAPAPSSRCRSTAVIAPARSILIWHPSIQVVVSFFGLSSGSNAELPPLGSRQQATPMPASSPAARAASRRRTSAA